MLEITNLDPLYIDIALGVIVGLGFLLGFIKGFKKIFFAFFLKVLAFVVAFSAVLNFAKASALEFVNLSTFLGNPYTGSREFDFILDLLPILVVSILFYLIIYRLFKFVFYILKKIFKKKKKRKKIINRLLGGFINGFVSLILISLLLLPANSELIGLDESIGKTTLTKITVESVDKVWDINLIDDYISQEKILIILIDGNILNDKDDELLDMYKDSFDNFAMLFNMSSEEIKQYYEERVDINADPEVREETINQIFKNMTTIVSLTNMLEDRNPNINETGGELLSRFVNNLADLQGNLPPTETIEVDNDIKELLLSKLNVSNLDQGIIENIEEFLED